MEWLLQGWLGGARIAQPCALARNYQYLNEDHFHPEAAAAIAAAPKDRRLYCLQSQSVEVMAAIHWDWAPPEVHPHLRAMTLHRTALGDRGRAAVVRIAATLAVRTAQDLALKQGLGNKLFADFNTLGATPADFHALNFTSTGHRWALPDSLGGGGRAGAMLRLTQLKATGVLLS